MKKISKTNKQLWNNWAKINSKSEFYNVDGFKSGKTSLRNTELTELGNVKDKSLLHLQCHFGLDTLSWAREGAEVTGVDFSDEAINLAKDLSSELKIPAKFICSDIYDLPAVLNQKFDIVFTSYGVLIWLFDLKKWADIVAHFLKPGGTFYIVEFHPFTHMFDENWKNLSEPYFYGAEPRRIIEQGSYAETTSDFSHGSYEWPHKLSDVINALRQVGIIIEFLHEFPFSSYNCFPSLVESKPNEYVLSNHKGGVPLMYSIKATYMPQLTI